MNDIARVIRQAAWRIGVSRFLEAMVWLACAAFLAAALVRVAEKLGLMTANWTQIAMYAPPGVIVLAIVYALVRRLPALAVARRVDEGADLRESLSTALHVQGTEDPWARNVVEYAQRKAVGVNVAQAVPITAPRRWPAVLIAAFALLITWLLPQYDVLNSRAKAEVARKSEEKAQQVKAETDKAINKIKEDLAKLDPGLKKDSGEDKKLEGEKAKPLTPEQIQRAAIKELTSLKEKAEQLREGIKAKTAETLADKLRDLKPGMGPMDKMASAMGQGDFAKAKQELQEMSKALANGEMSADQKAALEKQLENMAKQLDKMAAEKKELENKLAAAGLDPKLASSPEALKKALENLTPEQKQACENASQACQNASSQCESMSSAMSQLAQAMQKSGQEGQQQQADAAQALSDQLSKAEMAQAELDAAEAALSECNKELAGACEKAGDCEGGSGDKMGECDSDKPGTKPFSEGENEGQGAGRGGPGISSGGGDPGEAAAQEKWAKRKSRSPMGNGPMIGSMMIQGEQVKGESKAQFKEVVEAANKQAADQVTNNVIPREYQEVVKGYFSDLAKKAGTAEFKSETKVEAKPDAKKTDAGAKPADAKK
ncbi:MAG: hypothetical protein ACREJO_06350 [Phycisphaerales bacterium]